MKFLAFVAVLSAVLAAGMKVVLTYHPMMLLAEQVNAMVK